MENYDYCGILPPLPAKTGAKVRPVSIVWPQGTQITRKEGELLYEGSLIIPGEYNNASPEQETLGNNTTGFLKAYAEDTSKQQEAHIRNIRLRMDCMGCKAAVKIDGQEIRKHYGSFTWWDCDITEVVKNKTTADISVSLSGGEGELSPYQTAGIFGSISVMMLPECYIDDLSVRTGIKEDGMVSLHISCSLFRTREAGRCQIKTILEDGGGMTVLNQKWEVGDLPGNSRYLFETTLNPGTVILWDSEHPVLYQLRVLLYDGGEFLEEVNQPVGFRFLEKKNNDIFWNGRPLKLRGICYREPMETETDRDVRKDLELFQAANINYIRGLFYPFSKRFLDLCDEMGFYVEEAAAVCEVGQSISSTQNDPELREAYLGQLTETVVRDRSHVCILLWSLGSDSTWGDNFRQEYRLVKELDDTRLVTFHYPMTIPEEEPQMDVWQAAYVSCELPLNEHYDHMIIGHAHGSHNPIGYATGRASGYDMPVLHDAFAHLPCYNRDQIERDPGIHEFWGESIKRYWDKMWNTDGCLGGAVMAAVDEDGRFSDKLKDFNWGILDVFHHPKPEYHHLKMAYAPVKISEVTCLERETKLTIENRFNHTNLKEVELLWSCKEKSGKVILEAEPRQSQIVAVPAGKADGNSISVRFFCRRALIYETLLKNQDEKPVSETESQNNNVFTLAETESRNYNAFTLTETEKEIKIGNGAFSFEFSKETKLLTQAAADGIRIIDSGPYLQTTGLKLEAFTGTGIWAELTDRGAEVKIEGDYGTVAKVRFILSITKQGEIETSCRLLSITKPMPHTVKANVGLDCGGLEELGIWYRLYPEYEKLEWNRTGLWNCYPEKHIGRCVGRTGRENGDDFRSMKHHIRSARVYQASGPGGILVLSDGGHSIRMETEPHPETVIDDRDERITYSGNWYEMNDDCGNYRDTESLSKHAGDYLEFTFTGTGIRVYGPRDMICGTCDIYLDGRLVGQDLSRYPDRVDFPGMSRGYEKRYRNLLFSLGSLEHKEHCLRILVRGEKEEGAQDAYVSLDYIVIDKPEYQDYIKMIINNDFNYTRLVWGNYMRKKVEFKAGDCIGNTIRLLGEKAGGAIEAKI